jgi:hypothetical protein
VVLRMELPRRRRPVARWLLPDGWRCAGDLAGTADATLVLKRPRAKQTAFSTSTTAMTMTQSTPCDSPPTPEHGRYSTARPSTTPCPPPGPRS